MKSASRPFQSGKGAIAFIRKCPVYHVQLSHFGLHKSNQTLTTYLWTSKTIRLDECLGRDNWPKPACSLVLSEAISNQAVWPVISAITGPICALASNIIARNDLSTRGHHDWPVMAIMRSLRIPEGTDEQNPLAGRFPSLCQQRISAPWA
jgi:hypothetical protein